MTATLLVVEPNENLQRLLEVLLRDLGKVVLTSSTTEARQVLTKITVDVVLTDASRTRFGFDWIDELVNGGWPTIALTNLGRSDDLNQINDKATTLKRPFRPQALKTAVRALLEPPAG